MQYILCCKVLKPNTQHQKAPHEESYIKFHASEFIEQWTALKQHVRFCNLAALSRIILSFALILYFSPGLFSGKETNRAASLFIAHIFTSPVTSFLPPLLHAGCRRSQQPCTKASHKYC